VRGDADMNENMIPILIFGIYSIIVLITILIWIFIDPTEDLEDICLIGLMWPIALLLIVVFGPFKLLEILQNKLLERRAKKKYYDEDEYRSENEDWYSEE
jgi:hypothetical protein